MKRLHLLLLLGGALVALVLYPVWLSSQPDRFLSGLSRQTGLLFTAHKTSAGLLYRLSFEDLRIGPPRDPSGHGVTLNIDHAVLSARGLHSAKIRFYGLNLESRNPFKSLLLTSLDNVDGSFIVKEFPGRVAFSKINMNEGPLRLDGTGVIREPTGGKTSTYDFRFMLESRGKLGQFLGFGKMRGRMWGEGDVLHLTLGNRKVF